MKPESETGVMVVVSCRIFVTVEGEEHKKYSCYRLFYNVRGTKTKNPISASSRGYSRGRRL